MNKIFIVANWKMNPATLEEAIKLFNAVKAGVVALREVEVVLCPPFPFLSQLLASENVQFGAQNCFWEQTGAFTGEVSPLMLRKLECSYVILGHSERKNYLLETSEMINRKFKAAAQADLLSIVCIGEKERQAESNKTELTHQMQEVLFNVTPQQVLKLILVYEPEWAISSNKDAQVATPQDCARSIASMRKILQTMFGKDIAPLIPILYGGSTNSENIKGFLESGAQGALVGSASLNANEFIRLVKNAVS